MTCGPLRPPESAASIVVPAEGGGLELERAPPPFAGVGSVASPTSARDGRPSRPSTVSAALLVRVLHPHVRVRANIGANGSPVKEAYCAP